MKNLNNYFLLFLLVWTFTFGAFSGAYLEKNSKNIEIPHGEYTFDGYSILNDYAYEVYKHGNKYCYVDEFGLVRSCHISTNF